jgi:hypothetical protein
MTSRDQRKDQKEWTCARCGIDLELAKVQITYVGCSFTIDALRCPQCQLVLVTEDMAVGKLAEAERVLEDK